MTRDTIIDSLNLITKFNSYCQHQRFPNILYNEKRLVQCLTFCMERGNRQCNHWAYECILTS